MPLILVLIAIPGLIVVIDFIGFLITGKSITGRILISIAEIGALLILPYMYAGFGKQNICCADEINTAAFSPQHQFTILVIIILCLISYFFSKFRNNIAPPVIEVLINSLILIGIILNIFIAFHTTDFFFSTFGNVPVILLGTRMLIKNQQLFIKTKENKHGNYSGLEAIVWKILSAKPLVKFPVLLILCLPVLLILISALLLFGQKPDSIIRAFTDTYRHGFSQWNYQCANVECGDRYLCSVAANGHRKMVRPVN